MQVDTIEDEPQGRRIVETIMKAIWSFHECPWEFDDPDTPMGCLQKQMAHDQTMVILHQLEKAGFAVGAFDDMGEAPDLDLERG